MWRAIFGFEIRYHLRQPLFPLVTFVLSVLLFAAGSGQTPGSAVGQLHLNAPAVILEQLMKGIFLVLFLMTAFVVSAAVRDFDRRTSELFFATPISRFDYLTARFAGTMVVCTLPYVIGAAALAASSFVPGLDPARLGPFRLAPYAFGVGVLIVPTILALGAAFFALASWTRSTLATYVGVVAFFAVGAAAGVAASRTPIRWIGELLDPFGVVALGGALRYWTVAELNTTTPAIGGMLLWNRILWLALGFSALAVAVVTFDPSRSRTRRVRDRRAADDAPPAEPSSRVRVPTARRAFAGRTLLLQFGRRLRHETTIVLGSLPFVGILALGLLVLLQSASDAGNLFGMPAHPRTHLMLEALQGTYSIVLLIVVVLSSGESIWKERSLEVDAIHDAMPTPSGVYLGAKLAALLLTIAVWLGVGVLALIGFQLAHGYTDLELGLYARGAALAAVYPTLMLALACSAHVVARSKLAGYGIVLLFIIGWDFLEEVGFEDHLYRYASLPPTSYLDLAGYGAFLAPFGWYALYWGFAALVLVGLSILFWQRGSDDAWRVRRAAARARFRGPVRAIVAVGVVGVVATGGWIFHDTHVRGEYLTADALADRRAAYERQYRRYQQLDLPRIVAVRADVDIYPERRRVEIHGSYRLRNGSGRPLHELHLSIPERVTVNRLRLPDHEVILRDDALGYGIYRLRAPLAVGDSIEVGFDLAVEQRGYVDRGAEAAVIGDATYFTKRDLFPVIGYDAHRQLADPAARRRRGVEPVLRRPDVDDHAARRNTPRASDADRVDFETTISTSVDQIAVTSGELLREWVANGRRFFHYRAEHPITHHFAFASARYAVTRGEWHGTAIEVYHDPRHGANVARMIEAARKSIAYHTANFAPYPHRQLRIVEFPGYVRDATSFPGMIAFSEALGFNARLDRATAIDYPFYVTAHEVAHQWWGQQVVAADVQGAGMLHETLAQYSALMVTEGALGRPMTRRVLARELDWYLRGRAGERGVEPPLARVDGQDYVYYHKGALAMYALRDAAGEATLDSALARYFSSVALQGPPYTTTAELLDAFRATVPDESKQLVEDLFERITRFDTRLVSATASARADGSFLLRVEVASRKLRGDGDGTEREIPIDDWLDVAVFGEGEDDGDVDDALHVGRQRLRASSTTFELVVPRRPARVVIDPYHKLVDRDRGDHARTVSLAAR